MKHGYEEGMMGITGDDQGLDFLGVTDGYLDITNGGVTGP